MSNVYKLSTEVQVVFPDIDWRFDVTIAQPLLRLPVSKSNICIPEQPQNPNSSDAIQEDTSLCPSWFAVPGADTYLLQWSLNSDFVGPSVQERILSNPAFNPFYFYCLTYPFEIRQGETIFWRVTAANLVSRGVSPPSEIREFTLNCRNDGLGGLREKYNVQQDILGKDVLCFGEECLYGATISFSCFPGSSNLPPVNPADPNNPPSDPDAVYLKNVVWEVQTMDGNISTRGSANPDFPGSSTQEFLPPVLSNSVATLEVNDDFKLVQLVLGSERTPQVLKICSKAVFAFQDESLERDDFDISFCKRVLITDCSGGSGGGAQVCVVPKGCIGKRQSRDNPGFGVGYVMDLFPIKDVSVFRALGDDLFPGALTHTKRLLNNRAEIVFSEFDEISPFSSTIHIDPASLITLGITFEDPEYSIDLVSGRYRQDDGSGNPLPGDSLQMTRIEVNQQPQGSYQVVFIGESDEPLGSWFLEIDRLCSYNVTSVDSPCYIAKEELTTDGPKPTIALNDEIICDTVARVSTGGTRAIIPLGEIFFEDQLTIHTLDVFLTFGEDEELLVELSVDDASPREATKVSDIQYQIIHPEPMDGDTQDIIDSRITFTVAVSDAVEWQRVFDEMEDGSFTPREIEVRNPHAFCITACDESYPLLKSTRLSSGVTLLDTLPPQIFQLDSASYRRFPHVSICSSSLSEPYRSRVNLAYVMISVLDENNFYELQRTCQVFPVVGYQDPRVANAEGLMLFEAQVIDGVYTVQRQIRDNRLYTTPTEYVNPSLEQTSV